MYKFKCLFILASLLPLIPASLSQDEVQRRPIRKPLFLNEKRPNDDVTLDASEYTSDFHSDTSDINSEYKPWQYRSEIDDFPTNVRTYKIYNPRGSLAIKTNGQVYATLGNAETKFKMMLYGIHKGKYRVRLKNEKHHKFIAISCKTGIVYSTTNEQNLETVLIYQPKNGNTRFRSEKCPQSSNDWYLGVNKDGSIKNAKTASVSGTGTKFLLIPV
ncbi:uncharacterized protein LOC114525777 isoform X2 [Dendronephthya gigantea]|uniref:uncharacterized protein LOC114525777 isoform X2 n=1 Tax=Dendronephthya gigantea TaxID=151771 RepID=UPI00106BEECF|nr:uncharacterized protein LOC114525777 isoform X2 [Dendronephthya gigantea]